MRKENSKNILNESLKRALNDINEHLVNFGPDKEMELLSEYLYKKIWPEDK
jgi:hypothetical protein